MNKIKTIHPPTLKDSYLQLVRELPLRAIKTDAQHVSATAMISRLINRKLDAGQSDYLDALIVLVNQYEDEHHTPAEQVTPRDVLRMLMESNKLTQADVGRIIGSESAVSMFLGGSRELSKSQIKKLADRFKIDAGVFID